MTGESPYDNIWSWLAVATIGFSVATFVFLRTGGFSIFPSDDALVQDDAMVTVAFWGALISSAGLLGLGILARRYAGSEYARAGFSWPRLVKVETEARDPFVARIALSVTLVLPLAATAASLYVYVTKSRISLWDATTSLAPGFFSSRAAALRYDCEDTPCFRFHPKDGIAPFGQEWFWFSDSLLLLLLVGCMVVWGLFVGCLRWPTHGSAP